LTPAEAVTQSDWPRITQLTRQAAALKRAG
jgi:hypothetical protein